MDNNHMVITLITIKNNHKNYNIVIIYSVYITFIDTSYNHIDLYHIDNHNNNPCDFWCFFKFPPGVSRLQLLLPCICHRCRDEVHGWGGWPQAGRPEMGIWGPAWWFIPLSKLMYIDVNRSK